MNDQTAAPAPHEFADTAALDALHVEAASNEPPAAGAAPLAPLVDPAANVAEAHMIVGICMDIIGTKVGVTFDMPTKQTGAQKLAPVLAKYGSVMPPWLQPYKEEVALGIWAATVAFQTWMMIQAKKAADAAAAPAPQAGHDMQMQTAA